LSELQKEEFEKLKAGRNFPKLLAGDSIEVHKFPFVTSKDADIIKGVVVGITNRGNETAIKMLNVSFM
jgi:ribosomal protein L19